MKKVLFLLCFILFPYFSYSQTHNSTKDIEEYIEVIFYNDYIEGYKVYVDNGIAVEEKKMPGTKMQFINEMAADGWILIDSYSAIKVPASKSGTLPASDTYYIYVMKRIQP